MHRKGIISVAPREFDAAPPAVIHLASADA
jgi:hypothetical protein